MRRSRRSQRAWVVEPVETIGETEYRLSEVILVDRRGNRWVVEAKQLASSYPHLFSGAGVTFSEERGDI